MTRALLRLVWGFAVVLLLAGGGAMRAEAGSAHHGHHTAGAPVQHDSHHDDATASVATPCPDAECDMQGHRHDGPRHEGSCCPAGCSMAGCSLAGMPTAEPGLLTRVVSERCAPAPIKAERTRGVEPPSHPPQILA